MKASKKGKLMIGDLAINVSMYLAIDQTGLSTHLYHEDCGSRISMPRTCLDHPEMLPISTYNAIELDGHQIRVGWDDRKRLLMTDATEWPAVGSIALDKLAGLIASRSLVLGGLYALMPQQQDCQFVKISQDAGMLRALADRLRQHKNALIIQAPVLGCMRYCLLIASGTNLKSPASLSLIPLMFEEEIRPIHMDYSDGQYAGLIDLALKQVPKTMPQLTNKPLTQRIELWIKNRTPKPKRMRVVKHKETIDA